MYLGHQRKPWETIMDKWIVPLILGVLIASVFISAADFYSSNVCVYG